MSARSQSIYRPPLPLDPIGTEHASESHAPFIGVSGRPARAMTDAHLLQSWNQRTASDSDPPVVWYERGEGPPVLFLHGNWDHLMYVAMLENLLGFYRILLLKQRGTDCWKQPDSYNTLPLDPFLTDIETLYETIGAEKLRILGHSWGATLALHYACRYPAKVDKLVLVSMGPLNDQMIRYYKANIRRMIPSESLAEFDRVNRLFRDELSSGSGVSAVTDESYADLHSRLWAYSHENADLVKQQYLAAGRFRRVAAGAHPRTARGLLDMSDRVTCPTLIVYGYQDYEPIIQAFLLKERIQHAEIELINQCSHFPWIDQPQEFYDILTRFLS
jgi:proline iminopeptidase